MSTIPEYYKIVAEVFEKYKDKEFLFVGRHIQRWDSIEKIKGRALFAADFATALRQLSLRA
jgi:hypothetical protein